MNSNIIPINGASPFDQLRRTRDDGTEFWSARDLMQALAYVQWRKFEDAIERATIAIKNTEMPGQDHIAGADKMVDLGSGAVRYITDYHLTRYGSYMLAMNCDPRKPEVAAAQTYFAIRTREAETAQPRRELTFAEKTLEVMDGLRELVNNQRLENERQAKQLEAQAPLVARAQTYAAHDRSIPRQTFARQVAKWAREQRGITIPFEDVYVFLSRRLHLFIAGNRSDAGQATADAEKRHLAETDRGTAPNGHNYATGKLTPRGQEYAWQRVTQHIEAYGDLKLEGEISA